MLLKRRLRSKFLLEKEDTSSEYPQTFNVGRIQRQAWVIMTSSSFVVCLTGAVVFNMKNWESIEEVTENMKTTKLSNSVDYTTFYVSAAILLLFPVWLFLFLILRSSSFLRQSWLERSQCESRKADLNQRLERKQVLFFILLTELRREKRLNLSLLRHQRKNIGIEILWRRNVLE